MHYKKLFMIQKHINSPFIGLFFYDLLSPRLVVHSGMRNEYSSILKKAPRKRS